MWGWYVSECMCGVGMRMNVWGVYVSECMCRVVCECVYVWTGMRVSVCVWWVCE